MDIINRDSEFRYQLLNRLQSDCKYYLGNGNRHKGCLWAGDEKEQIDTMLELYNSFNEDEKPEWLTLEQIMEYSKKMLTSLIE